MKQLLLTETVDILRLEDDDSGETESYSPHITGYKCNIQSDEAAFSEDLNGSYGKNSMMYGGVADIKETDVVVHGSKRYKVIGVESLTFRGDNHLEIIIREFLAQT